VPRSMSLARWQTVASEKVPIWIWPSAAVPRSVSSRFWVDYWPNSSILLTWWISSEIIGSRLSSLNISWPLTLDKVVCEQLRSEIEQIDELFEQFAELIASSVSSEPDLVQRAALASVLHSFYTGVEAILLTVAKRVDAQVPVGARWHRDLLDQSVAATDRRPAVLTAAVRTSLDRYLAFRHFFRQAYSFVLRWDDMRDLVTEVQQTWTDAKRDIERWLAETQPLA
jgi:hypothetical protein